MAKFPGKKGLGWSTVIKLIVVALLIIVIVPFIKFGYYDWAEIAARNLDPNCPQPEKYYINTMDTMLDQGKSQEAGKFMADSYACFRIKRLNLDQQKNFELAEAVAAIDKQKAVDLYLTYITSYPTGGYIDHARFGISTAYFDSGNWLGVTQMLTSVTGSLGSEDKDDQKELMLAKANFMLGQKDPETYPGYTETGISLLQQYYSKHYGDEKATAVAFLLAGYYSKGLDYDNAINWLNVVVSGDNTILALDAQSQIANLYFLRSRNEPANKINDLRTSVDEYGKYETEVYARLESSGVVDDWKDGRLDTIKMTQCKVQHELANNIKTDKEEYERAKEMCNKIVKDYSSSIYKIEAEKYIEEHIIADCNKNNLG